MPASSEAKPSRTEPEALRVSPAESVTSAVIENVKTGWEQIEPALISLTAHRDALLDRSPRAM